MMFIWFVSSRIPSIYVHRVIGYKYRATLYNLSPVKTKRFCLLRQPSCPFFFRVRVRVRVIVFNGTFNNISVID
jgi:hypothetical protein